MVPEIWSATECFVILDHFLSFYPPKDLKNQKFEKMKKKHQEISFYTCATINDNHNVWFLTYGLWQTKFFSTLDHFLPFYLPNDPKNQNVLKKKKAPGDIIILHKCTKNENHMMYGSWDIKCNGPNFLFWTAFCPFTP